MKARCIDFTGDRAVALITPSWWRRLFGARESAVDLEWAHRGGALKDWRTVASQRWVDPHLPLSGAPYAREILRALDFREGGAERRGAPAKPKLSLVGDEAVMP